MRLKTTVCDYEKIFRSTCATEPISIFVFVLRELQRFLMYFVDAKSCIHSAYNTAAGKKWVPTRHRRQSKVRKQMRV